MSVIVHSPPNTMPRINSIWAYVSVDASGNEGLCAAKYGPGGMLLPLIAADPERLQALTPFAEALAERTGMTIKLVEFTTRNELREITGASS